MIGRDKAVLAANSPNELTDRIQIPVLLAHGRLDGRADIRHARLMETALRRDHKSVELIEYPYEGHSLASDEHRQDFYTRLLAFLDKHIGAGAAKTASP